MSEKASMLRDADLAFGELRGAIDGLTDEDMGREWKWGDYDDLSPIAGMPDLCELWLGGASSVRTLTPHAELQ